VVLPEAARQVTVTVDTEPTDSVTGTDMKTTTLGKSEFHVSRIAFGTWQLGGDWDSFDEDAAIATKTGGYPR